MRKQDWSEIQLLKVLYMDLKCNHVREEKALKSIIAQMEEKEQYKFKPPQ